MTPEPDRGWRWPPRVTVVSPIGEGFLRCTRERTFSDRGAFRYDSAHAWSLSSSSLGDVGPISINFITVCSLSFWHGPPNQMDKPPNT